MSDEQARVSGQRQDLVDRLPQVLGAAAREIGARGARVGLHQRVMHEGRVPADKGDRSQRVARRQHHPRVQIADAEGLAIGEQAVEVAGGIEGLGQMVKIRPEAGDLHHLLADGRDRPRALLQQGRGHDVIGMGMGVQHPFDRQAVAAHQVKHLVHAVGRKAGAARVEVPHDIDQRGLSCRGVGADILDRAGVRLVDAPDIGAARPARRRMAHDGLFRLRIAHALVPFRSEGVIFRHARTAPRAARRCRKAPARGGPRPAASALPSPSFVLPRRLRYPFRGPMY